MQTLLSDKHPHSSTPDLSLPKNLLLPTLALQGEHIIRYLSMWDNKYQRYFKGHVQEVTTLAMNPKNDMLLSGARVSSKPEHCLAVQLGSQPDAAGFQAVQLPASSSPSTRGRLCSLW